MKHRAFTLIEVLVVVAIIALLLAILLPSLSVAREQGRTAVCLASLRQIGIALGAYSAEMKEALAGPNTSGIPLGNTAYVFRNTPQEPSQNMDWVSPMMARQMGLPAARDARLVRILNNELKCPSNSERYKRVYGGGDSGPSVTIDPAAVSYSSYSAMLGFHVKSDFDRNGVPTGFRGPIFAPSEITAAVDIAQGYQFKTSSVGAASRKVFVAEGARFIDNGETSFNPFIKQIRGGNFMDAGPSIHFMGGTPYRRDADLSLTTDAQRFAYRHRGRINMVYFDAHAQTHEDKNSLKVGMFFPRRSVVVDAAATADPTDTNGQVID